VHSLGERRRIVSRRKREKKRKDFDPFARSSPPKLIAFAARAWPYFRPRTVAEVGNKKEKEKEEKMLSLAK